MIDWSLVLGAFCGGLALTVALAAWEGRARPSARWLMACAALTLVGGLAIANLFRQAASTASASEPTSSQEVIPTAAIFTTTRRAPAPTASASLAPRALPDSTRVLIAEPIELIPPRLVIASLGIDETVSPVAIRDGSWDLEALGRNVGWLETTGAHPNDALAMALVGHITLALAQRGPFADLQHIPRDGAVVYAVDGLEYHYTVRSVRRLEPDDVESLYVHDGRALLLLTCTDWDPERRIYASRLLVTAELVQITEGNGPQ